MAPNNCNCNNNCICNQLTQLQTLSGTITNIDNSISGQISTPIMAGVKDYELLDNKPSIESVPLIGNKDFIDLGLIAISADDLLDILV